MSARTGDITGRIDAVTAIGPERLISGGIQPVPKSVKIELTARCNLRCRYCAVQTRKHDSPLDMSFWFFQKITEDMRLCGVEEIGLFYLGEPFMNKKLLCEAADWVKNGLRFPYVFLTSNAVAADSMTVAKLMHLGVDSIKWSVNAASPEQFREITRGTDEQFHRALENIRHAWEVRRTNGYSTMLSASSILYEGDYHAGGVVGAMLEETVKPFVDRHYWLPLYQMSMYADKIKSEMGYVPTAGNMGRIDEETMLPTRKPLPCWSAFTEGHVRVDGGLSACCFGADDRFDMGILDGTNFVRQWNSPKFQSLRQTHLMTITDGQDALKGTPCEVCVAWNDDSPGA